MNEKKLLLELIRSEIFGKSLLLTGSIDEETLKKLYILSQKHDIIQIVANALIKNNLIENDGIKKSFDNKKMLAVFRREQIDFEESRVFEIFEREGIDYIPLKGSVIKGLYPEKWMRTSCDTDILIREQDLEKASTLLTESLGFTDEGQHFHDRSFITKNNVHIELHFSLKEQYDKFNTVLDRVCEYAKNQDGRQYVLDNEFLIFYTVAHMQAHFVGGGCGIRPFIDLKLLTDTLSVSKEKLDELIDECKIRKFFDSVIDLNKVWFEGKEHSELTRDMENYIFEGGAFGSRANYSAATRHQKGGKIGYLITRVFPSKIQMKSMFPNLNQRPILLPYYYVKRWFGLFNIKWAKNISHEFISKEKEKAVSNMMKELDI